MEDISKVVTDGTLARRSNALEPQRVLLMIGALEEGLEELIEDLEVACLFDQGDAIFLGLLDRVAFAVIIKRHIETLFFFGLTRALRVRLIHVG